MLARRFVRPQNALRRKSAQKVLRAGGLEDREDLDGRGKDCGGEGTETEAETESWGQMKNYLFGPKLRIYVEWRLSIYR